MKQNCSKQWEVIFVDNRCSDSSLAVAEKYQQTMPNLRIVQAWERQGKSYALNRGVAEAEGNCLIFADADDVMAPGYIQAMGDALEEHELVASRLDYEKLNSPEIALSRKNTQYNGLQQYRYPPFLPHAGGGSLGMHKSVFNRAGGFDEDFLCLEDTDFCFRVQLMGIALHFVPDAVMLVRFRQSVRDIFRQQQKWGEYNVRLYKRYSSQGMPPIPRLSGLKRTIRQSGSLHMALRRQTRSKYVYWMGWNMGRLKGCVKYRVWAL